MLIVPLADLDASSLALAGGKAAQLGMMLGGGLPVPPGFCITTAAFRRGMDARLREAIATAYSELGGGGVAVRSSATAEDLPHASFAGQQDTFLNVSGESAVLEAVQACWASLRSERAVAYRRDRGIPEDSVAMAVVVQRMVAAQAAGVLFTLNPVTGALDEIVVEAARGLGDKVVSARVTPDRYRLRRRAPHQVIAAEGSETAALFAAPRLAELARLALAAERLLGRAADIEFALDAERIWLLQARAVTAAGPPVPQVRYGSKWNEEHCRGRLVYWGNYNLRETMPYPHTPFSWSLWNYLALPHAGLAMGLVDEYDVAHPDHSMHIADLVEGRVYFNMNAVRGFLGFLPDWLQVRMARAMDAEVGEIVEELYRTGGLQPLKRPWRWRRAWYGMRHAPGGLVAIFRRGPDWAWRQLEEARQEVTSFRKIDLRILNEEQILALARYFATQTVPRTMPTLAVSIPAALAAWYLADALPRWGLGEHFPRLMSGLRGIPTMETALAMWDVAASATPEVRAIFAGEPVERVLEILDGSAAGRAFRERLDAFLQEHGHRAVREFDFSCPRWSEDPTFVLETIRNYLGHPPGAPTPREHYQRQTREHDDAKTAADRALRGRPLRRWLFRKLIRAVETRMPLREAPKFYALMGLAHVRSLYLEVGRRLVARGILEKQDDFFFLTIPELERICAGQLDAAWVREQIPPRRLEFARHIRANPPLVVRSDGRPVVKPAAPSGPVLRGTPVSWGTARGPARILMDPGDGAALRKGDILVAPCTDPGWTPLFLTAGALVMEIGGVISHGAVVAREYGIPAVVGVKDATRILRDGEMLEVDGASGEVRRAA